MRVLPLRGEEVGALSLSCIPGAGGDSEDLPGCIRVGPGRLVHAPGGIKRTLMGRDSTATLVSE